MNKKPYIVACVITGALALLTSFAVFFRYYSLWIEAFSTPLHIWGILVSCMASGNWMKPSPAFVLLGIAVSVVLSILLGLLFGRMWLAGCVRSKDRDAGRSKFKRLFHLFWPFFTPCLFCLLYTPIDINFTVKRFGCGCHFDFNANFVNELLRSSVLIATVCLITLHAPGVSQKWRRLYLFGGISLMVYVSAFFCQRIWL